MTRSFWIGLALTAVAVIIGCFSIEANDKAEAARARDIAAGRFP